MDATGFEAAPRRRLTILCVVVGVALMAGSLAGVSRALQQPPAETTKPAAEVAKDDWFPQATAFGYGDLRPGVTPLHPLVPGRVVKIHVSEGDTVKAGDALFVLDDTAARADVAAARADLHAAETRLDAARKVPEQYAARLKAQIETIESRQSEKAAADALFETAQKNKGIKVLNITDEDLNIGRQKVRSIEAAVRAEQAKLTAIKTEDPTIPEREASHEVEAKRAQLQKAEFTLSQCTIKAPADGEVLRLLTSVGETLGANPHQAALIFAQAGQRIIRAEVEQEFASRVRLHVGQKAQVHDDSSARQEWTGTVERIGDWFTHRRSILQEPLQYNDVRTLECIVKLDKDQPAIKIGQRFRVTLLKEGN